MFHEKAISFTLDWTTRPLMGGAITAAFGQLWGPEDADISDWFWTGVALGAAHKGVMKSKLLTIGQKNLARDVIFNKKKPLTFDHHNETFIEVLKKFEFLKDKRIIIFYINGHQQKFSNFPSGKSKDFNNLEYIDLNIEEDTSSFYLIDGHLNSTGHMKIAEKLSKLF